ncbi:sensor domain-containing protein [Nonomuraea ferruginea]
MAIYAAYAYGVGVAAGGVLLALAVLSLPAAAFERWRLRLVDRAPVDDPHVRPPRPGPRAWLATRLREQATWRELGFTVIAVSVMWWMDLGFVSSAIWLPLMLLSAPFQPSLHLVESLPLIAAGLLLSPLFAYMMTAWSAPARCSCGPSSRRATRRSSVPAPGWSTRSRSNAAGSSVTCTTAPSSGWWPSA